MVVRREMNLRGKGTGGCEKCRLAGYHLVEDEMTSGNYVWARDLERAPKFVSRGS
jgi:hypothetical protein